MPLPTKPPTTFATALILAILETALLAWGLKLVINCPWRDAAIFAAGIRLNVTPWEPKR